MMESTPVAHNTRKRALMRMDETAEANNNELQSLRVEVETLRKENDSQKKAIAAMATTIDLMKKSDEERRQGSKKQVAEWFGWELHEITIFQVVSLINILQGYERDINELYPTMLRLMEEVQLNFYWDHPIAKLCKRAFDNVDWLHSFHHVTVAKLEPAFNTVRDEEVTETLNKAADNGHHVTNDAFYLDPELFTKEKIESQLGKEWFCTPDNVIQGISLCIRRCELEDVEKPQRLEGDDIPTFSRINYIHDRCD